MKMKIPKSTISSAPTRHPPIQTRIERQKLIVRPRNMTQSALPKTTSLIRLLTRSTFLRNQPMSRRSKRFSHRDHNYLLLMKLLSSSSSLRASLALVDLSFLFISVLLPKRGSLVRGSIERTKLELFFSLSFSASFLWQEIWCHVEPRRDEIEAVRHTLPIPIAEGTFSLIVDLDQR